MATEQMIPHVLEHIDLERWGRPAQLVPLVAELTVAPCPAPIDRSLLEALGRTPDQARYDHRVLARLASRDRVLIRWQGSGRHPDCWAINPDLSHWRRVPWLTSRRRVVALFLALYPENAVPLWGKRAAQEVAFGHTPPLPEGEEPNSSTLNPRPSIAQDRTSIAQSPAETGPHSHVYGPDPAPPVHAFRETYVSHSLEAREGGSEDAKMGGADRLVAVLARTIGVPVFGALASQVRDIAAAHPDRIEELVALAGRLTSIRTASGGVQALAEGAALLTARCAPGPSREVRIATLRRLIATLEVEDPDGEAIELARSELTDLGNL